MRPRQRINTNTMDLIQKAVETVTGCDIMLKTRQKCHVQARNIFYFYSRSYGITLENIGLYLNKDHATVLHGLNKYDIELDYDKTYKRNSKAVSEILSSVTPDESIKATDTLLEALEIQNKALKLKVMELQQLVEPERRGIDDILQGIPEDRIEFFKNNQLKSFVAMERAIMRQDQEREAQRAIDKADKEAFKTASMYEDGAERYGDAKVFTYLSS